MKKLLKLLVVTALTFVSSVAVMAENKISVSLNGSPVSFETEPEIINGSTMIPLRSIFEEMGYDILWDGYTQTISLSGKNNILLTVNSTSAYKNDSAYSLNTAPIIKDGYTLVPLRFVAESADAEVNWYEDTKTVEIFTSDFTASHNIIPVNVSTETLKESTVMINTDKHQGSGVILSEDGYIVTNFHVLAGSNKIVVDFNDGTRYSGDVTIAAYDTARDVVILKINKSGLTSAPLGDSDAVKIGDSVTAVGSPGGEFNQATTGTVNEKNKYIISSSAFIKGGSSGGGLFNSNGEVIGITSSYDATENYMSIPINHIKTLKLTENINLTQWSSISPKLISPSDFSYYLDGESAIISWDSVYGADFYHIYSAYSENGEFKQVKNPTTLSYKWNWGFPYCFKIHSEKGNVFYFKIASVKDGVESELSKAYRIEF